MDLEVPGVGEGGPVCKKMRHIFFSSTISGSSDLEPEFMGSNVRFTSWMELFLLGVS